MCVCMEWRVLKYRCVIINVYSKCDVEAKRRLWGKLLEFRREIGEASWCILGDFNVVCHGKEIRVVNVDPTTSQAIEINHFD